MTENYQDTTDYWIFFLEKQTLSHNLNEIRILVTNIDYKKSLLLKKYKNVDIKFSAHDAFLE